MASSQVEIASSSSPFGCILRDHNRGRAAGAAGGGGASAFQKNLKELVRDRLHTCISVSPCGSSDNAQFCATAHHRPHHGNPNFLGRGSRGNDGDDSMMMMMSHKQAKLLDRWAAKQAKGMVSELKAEDENLAASSLVQIWEARLSPRPHLPQAQNKPPPVDSNPSLPSTSGSCSFSSSLESDGKALSGLLDTAIHVPAPTRDDSSSVDWESATVQGSSVPSRRHSDAGGDTEKLRVADIIRRLTSDACNDNGEQSGGDSPVHRVVERRLSSASSSSDQAEATLRVTSLTLPQVVASPRMIRGRQAFHDLLLQLERERHAEIQSLAQRHVVSKFPQRGRIQSMLRLRVMQRGIGIRDHLVAPSSRSSRSADSTSQNQGSSISHLRERFSVGVEQAITAPGNVATSPASSDAAHSRAGVGLASTCKDSSQHKVNASTQQLNPPERLQDSSAVGASELPTSPEKPREIPEPPTEDASVDDRAETDAAGELTCQGASSCVENQYGSQETSETSAFMNEWDEDEIEEEEEEEEEANELGDFENTMDDWFSSISRPRSYWEGMRQAWYQELLSTTSDNDEIRKLLERRTVSSFLASDFRERMDRLMVSRSEVQAIHQHEEMEDSQERMGELMLSYFQRHTHSTCDQAGADEEQLGEEERPREGSPNTHHQYMEPAEYVDQARSVQFPSPPSDDNVVNEASQEEPHELEGAPRTRRCPPPPPPPPPEVSREDRQTLTSRSQPSTEMELIRDMRGQMEQLQREMSELRKSLHACMEMQLQLQASCYTPVRRDQANLVDRTQKRRICCICYETQVDTFLYRCGHMCTCLKCAHELQWSSGKCPICRAPILDVVRAYLDS